MNRAQQILEKTMVDQYAPDVALARDYQAIADLFVHYFGLNPSDIPGQEAPATPDEYKNDKSDFGLKSRGIKTREKINEQVKEILSRVTDPAKLTQEELALLKQYSGKGGLSENSQFEYYTPTHVAEGVWDAMKANGFGNGNVLDPCVGAGVFSAIKPKGTIIKGVDIDPIGSKVAALLNPEDSIQTKSLEELVGETPDDFFDGVVGNVPFGAARGKSAHEDAAYKTEKRIERYFILRTLDKIKPGKLACLVVPINIVGAKGKGWEQFRIAVSKKAEFLGAHKLPSKTFGAQGTDTVVDVIVLKKHPKDLLDKMDSLRFETLKETKVLWDEFLQGDYWKGEGLKFIMGKYVPKEAGNRFSHEQVDGGDLDNEGLKKKLAMRFDSRIDWDALDVAEVAVKNYAEGDRRIINGVQCEFQGGEWVKVLETQEKHDIDAAKYGVASIEELKAKLANPRGALEFSASQMWGIFKAWPELLTELQKESIQFAMTQDSKLHEQVYRGAIIGGLLGRFKVKVQEGEAEDTERLALQEMMTQEIDRFGHPRNNKKLNLLGSSSRTFGIFMNSVDLKGNFSPLLSGTMESDKDFLQFDSTSIQSIVEHLFIREGITSLELEDIKKVYTGNRELKTLGDLASDENIALTPDGLVMPLSRWAAGDIYPKMQAIKDAMGVEEDPRIKEKYTQQVEAILKRRTVTAPEDVTFGLRQKWINKKYILEFLKESGYPGMYYGSMKDVEYEDSVTGEMKTKSQFVQDPDDPFGHYGGYSNSGYWLQQFNSYMNGKNVTSSNSEYKEEYQRKAADLEERFNLWMQQHEDRDKLVDTYNRKFNGFLPYEYGEESLQLQEVSPQVKLHGFQNAGIRRLSEEGRGCLAFNVGLGKTYGSLGLYAYNKQMGRSKRTCIVVPNAVVGNWYNSAKSFLGDHANFLLIGLTPALDKDGKIIQTPKLDENGNPKKNEHTGEIEYEDKMQKRDSKEQVWEDMWKIPGSNIPLVIMSKEKFGTIPMKKESKEAYTKELVDRALVKESKAEGVNADNTTGREISYNEDVEKLRTEQKYSDEGTAKKGELPFFEDMGFTDVIVDECHEFKNSFEAGENTAQIAYLPTAPSAKRALDMAFKMHQIRKMNNGRGAYLLSATPVTNSPFEIFNILTLVCPLEEFERFGVKTVDDFIRVFGKIETVDKVMVSGETKSVDGLVGFQNLDGLRNLFHKYVNMLSVEDMDPPPFKLPPHDETHDEVDLTPEQDSIYEELRERAKDAAKPGDAGSGESMFAVIRDMDRVTTDMDLYNRTMTFHFRKGDKDKVDAFVGKFPKTVKVIPVTDEEGNIQSYKFASSKSESKQKDSVEIPLVPKLKMDGEAYALVMPEYLEDYTVDAFREAGIADRDVGHPVTPKYGKMLERLKTHYESNGKQLIFTEEKSQHKKIERLIVHQIPLWENLIGVINADTASGEKMQQISGQYNSGKFRFIIANKKAEVGVNLQKGTTAIHHLTLPWTPASIQQRNGRGVRQGNKAAHIDIYYYLGKGSFDGYRLSLLQKKSNWMRELFKGKDATAANANAFDADEFLDMLESDPEEAKRRRLEKAAIKAQEKKARADRILINTFVQLSHAKHNLSTVDQRKEETRAKLEKDIEEATAKIGRYKEKMAEAKTAKDEGEIAARMADLARKVEYWKEKLQYLDQNAEADKKSLEAKIKQHTGYLKGKAKKGELPFDESLIDKTDKVLVSVQGQMYVVGEMWEIESPKNGSKAIFKVLNVDNPADMVQLENVAGANRYSMGLKFTDNGGDYADWIFINDLPNPAKMMKVSYSEKEIALKKLFASGVTVEKIIASGIDKDTFHENISEMKIDTYETWVFRVGDKVSIGTLRTDGVDKTDILFPDPGNAEFKKSVCEAYLQMVRDDESGWADKDFMKQLFGNDYEAIALEYGKTATEAEATEAAAKAWIIWQNKVLENGDKETDPSRLHHLIQDMWWDISGTAKSSVGGDNTQEIEKWIDDYLNGLEADLSLKMKVILDQEKLQAERAEEKRKQDEIDAARANPNFKEVPENVKQAFAELGITVKTNMTNIVIPGFRGRRGTPTEPFTKWYFHDKAGKFGQLFLAKDMLKARFGASFFADAGGEFDGAWWHISSTINLQDVYELIA